MCSITGGPIEAIADAIDRLARDARDTAGSDLMARVAEIWAMVIALDPELARRQRRYASPDDGVPLS